MPQAALAAFLKRLRLRSDLDAEEADVILHMEGRVEHRARREDIVLPGDRTTHACLMMDGLAARYDQTDCGARQYTALHISGDMCDLHSAVLPVATWGIEAVNPVTILRVPHSALVWGKWGAVALMGMVVALLSSLSFVPAQWLLKSDSLQAMFQFGMGEVLAFWLLQIPLAAGLSGLLMALSLPPAVAEMRLRSAPRLARAARGGSSRPTLARLGRIKLVVIAGFVALALLLPSIGMSVRRLHDIDRTGWWVLLAFTGVGAILLIVWACFKGTDGPNRFGPDPLAAF